MVDKRRQKRRHLIYYLEIFERKIGRALGHLADLTSEGLLLLTEEDGGLAPGQALDLDIRLPEVPGLQSEKLYVKAVVRWTGLDKNPALHCAGCQFAPLGPQARRLPGRRALTSAPVRTR